MKNIRGGAEYLCEVYRGEERSISVKYIGGGAENLCEVYRGRSGVSL